MRNRLKNIYIYTEIANTDKAQKETTYPDLTDNETSDDSEDEYDHDDGDDDDDDDFEARGICYTIYRHTIGAKPSQKYIYFLYE